MKKSLKSVLFAGVLTLALAAQSAFAAYTISVETFRNSSGRYVPVDSIMEMMITELVNSGTFQVVERSRMDAIAREQRMAQSGMVDRRGAPQAGRLAGAQYIMTGAVTKYENSNTGGAAGAILGGRHGGLLGGLVNTNTAYVTLDARIVDTTTGAIVYAGRAEGAATDVMGGLVSRYGGFGSGRSGGQLATATHKAVTKVIDNLRSVVGAGAAPGNGEGAHVLENRGINNITIDVGSTNGGARRGMYYAVYREGEVIRDLHGNVLDAERDYIAVIQVIEARPQYSKCKLVRGRGLKRGDGIEPVRNPDQVRLYGE